MNHHKERLEKLILEELNKIISRELEFDGMLPTLTAVECSAKLDAARVKMSVWPSGKAKEVLAVFKKEQRKLQRLLMRRLRIRVVPRVTFEIDHGNENAAAVEKALLSE